MAATLKGLAVVYGVAGVTMTAGIVSATNGAQTQSLRLVRNSDKVEIKNDAGEVVGQVFVNGKKTLSLTVVPSHASAISSAQGSMDAYNIAAGTKITVVDAAGTVVDGDYNLISSTQNRTNDGVATLDLEMEKYDANDVTGTIT